jgi:alkaline phosphatase D
MKKIFTTFCILHLAFFISFSQHITHGPVTGALTANSARMYVRTDAAMPYTIEVSEHPNFSTLLSFPDSTLPELDNSRIITVSGLQPYTKYYYRVIIDGNEEERSGSFTTFPEEGTKGNYVLTTGSCQETANMDVFDRMLELEPIMMLHTGDFTYPSYQMNQDYPENYVRAQESWSRRYNEDKMKDMLLTVPIDYVADDDDNYNGNCAHYRTGLTLDTSSGEVVNGFTMVAVPEGARENWFRSYVEYFPGYEMVDTSEGLYHSFKMGNAEFFFMDTRATASPAPEAYIYDSVANHWTFEPDTNHRIISVNQMNWLKNSLAASTADWKFIVGGVPFNKSLRRLINFGIAAQGFTFDLNGERGSGFRLAASFSDYWAGFPHQQEELLSFIASNNIKDVISISGDTHHNVMDDGTNSGLPEMNASGLSVTNLQLAYWIDYYGQQLGQPHVADSLWNGGGNGVENMNFNNAFGKIEIFEDDSVQLCIIDFEGTTVSCMTIVNSTIASVDEAQSTSAKFDILVYPNPSDNLFTIKLPENYLLSGKEKCRIMDINGKLVSVIDLEKDKGANTFNVSVQSSPGIYLLDFNTGKKKVQKKLLVK